MLYPERKELTNRFYMDYILTSIIIYFERYVLSHMDFIRYKRMTEAIS